MSLHTDHLSEYKNCMVAPARVYQEPLFEAGIPWTAFNVDDVDTEFNSLSAPGVRFSMEHR